MKTLLILLACITSITAAKAGAPYLVNIGSTSTNMVHHLGNGQIQGFKLSNVSQPYALAFETAATSDRVRLTNSVTHDWMDFNDGLDIGDGANNRIISLRRSTGDISATTFTGSGANLTSLPGPTVSLATLTSGVWFTNTSGRFQEVKQSFTVTKAAVAGVSMVHLITGQQGQALGAWLTNASYGSQTTATSIAETNVAQLSWMVSNSIVVCFTNQLIGAGNAIAPRPNSSQTITY